MSVWPNKENGSAVYTLATVMGNLDVCFKKEECNELEVRASPDLEFIDDL